MSLEESKQKELNDAFWDAYRGDDLDLMEKLIQEGASPDAQNIRGATVLQMAAANKKLETVKWLIRHRANPDAQDSIGDSAMLRASRVGDLELVKVLIFAGANVNIKNALGSTPLMEAATTGKVEICKALVEAGALPNVVTKHGTTAVLNASSNKRAEILEMLLKVGGNANAADSYGTPAIVAAAWGSSMSDDAETAESMEKARRKNQKGEPVPFDERIVHNLSYKCVKSLVEAGANVNQAAKSGTTAVSNAALTSNWDVVEYLVAQGANPNVRTIEGVYGGYTPLMLAIAGCEKETMCYLLDHGADINMTAPNGQGPLEIAMTIAYGRKAKDGKEMVDELLKRGVSAKGKVEEERGGVGLWHMAVSGIDDTLYDKAIQGGANVNEKDHEGHTPAHYAVIMRKEKSLKKIMDNGGAINEKDKNEMTPLAVLATNPIPPALKLAISQTLSEDRKKIIIQKLEEATNQMAKSLVGYGADVNAVDKDGISVINMAVRYVGFERQKESFVDTLIGLGAKVDLRDKNSDHAVVTAAKLGNISLMEKLFSHLSAADKKNFILDCAWTAPEHYSVMEKFGLCLKKAMELGADIEALDDSGQNALIVAAATNQEDLVEVLLQLGANVNSQNSVGETALHHAASANAPNIMRILLKAGGDPNILDNERRDVRGVCYGKMRTNCLDIIHEFDQKDKEIELPSRFKL